MDIDDKSSLFIDWLENQYGDTIPSEARVNEVIAYINGILDATASEKSSYLVMTLECLRAAELMIRNLKRYQVRIPHGSL